MSHQTWVQNENTHKRHDMTAVTTREKERNIRPVAVLLEMCLIPKHKVTKSIIINDPPTRLSVKYAVRKASSGVIIPYGLAKT
jgi:hypothetical protein